MAVQMAKPGHPPFEVADEAVENFKANGFVVCDAAYVAPAKEKPDLSEKEIKDELNAVEKVTRKKGEEAGLTDDEIEADVAAEVSRVEISLRGE